ELLGELGGHPGAPDGGRVHRHVRRGQHLAAADGGGEGGPALGVGRETGVAEPVDQLGAGRDGEGGGGGGQDGGGGLEASAVGVGGGAAAEVTEGGPRVGVPGGRLAGDLRVAGHGAADGERERRRGARSQQEVLGDQGDRGGVGQGAGPGAGPGDGRTGRAGR